MTIRLSLRRFALITLFAMRATLAIAVPPTAPTGLRVNDVVDPVGTGADVSFGWLVNDPDANELQTRYRILVATSDEKLATDEGDVWDSGAVESRLQNHVAFAGCALQADRRYRWKVRTWDKDGSIGPWSAPAAFTVGLLRDSDWAGAHWIRRENTEADDYTYYRKRATLPAGKAVVRATAYVSAVHQYTLCVNGVVAGRGQAYHYPQYQYYRAHDITALLRAGPDNQLAVFTHWFGGGQGRPASARGLLVKIVVHHADGATTVLGTDDSWRQSRAEAWVLAAPVHRNAGEGVGYVETIDARKFIPGWTAPDFDDSAWKPAAVVGPHPVAPWTGTLAPDLTRITETVLAPASIIDKGGGQYVIDLGKVRAGLPLVRFSGGAPGETVSMRGGYVLDASGEIPNGAKSQATLMEYRAILDGRDFIYEPVEYLGMRYFQIDNAPMPVTPDNFAFVTRHSQLDAASSAFESSDATLNAVWGLMKDSLFLCAQEEFVDTPTREKGGFLGDSVIQSSVAMPVLRERALTRRALGEFLQSMEQYWQKPADRGRMNAVYPNGDGGRDIPDFTLAYPLWAWAYYLETGDRAFLATAYSKLRDIGDYVHRHIDPATGLVSRLAGGKGAYQYGIVDWPAPMRHGYDMETSARTVINGWAHADYEVLAKIADALGDAADRDLHRARAAALAEAINKRLRNPDGLYVDGLLSDGAPSAGVSQHANLFPLALGIVPAASRGAVLDHVKSQGMRVGMVTLPWLLRALGEAGEGPALLDLFTKADQPGWARCLARGATATWESWDSDEVPDDSLSHAWGASGLEACVRYVLGVAPLKPQYEEVLIRPLDFGPRLGWAKGRIATDRGDISVAWNRAEGSHTLHVGLPVNVTAQVALPSGPSAAPAVFLDGEPVHATREGAYLVVSGVGSGAHLLERRDTEVASNPASDR